MHDMPDCAELSNSLKMHNEVCYVIRVLCVQMPGASKLSHPGVYIHLGALLQKCLFVVFLGHVLCGHVPPPHLVDWHNRGEDTAEASTQEGIEQLCS